MTIILFWYLYKVEDDIEMAEVQTCNVNRPDFDWENVDLREFNRLKSFLGTYVGLTLDTDS